LGCLLPSMYILLGVNFAVFFSSFIDITVGLVDCCSSYKTTPVIRPDFRCTEIVKYHKIVPFKKVHHSCQVTLQKQWPYKKRTSVFRTRSSLQTIYQVGQRLLGYSCVWTDVLIATRKRRDGGENQKMLPSNTGLQRPLLTNWCSLAAASCLLYLSNHNDISITYLLHFASLF
jgi:hypothetical protein